jgi:hypothetical protein
VAGNTGVSYIGKAIALNENCRMIMFNNFKGFFHLSFSLKMKEIVLTIVGHRRMDFNN